MKKLRTLTAWAIAALACATAPILTSCNDDDNNKKSADLSQGVYQAYEVNFISTSQANVFANLRSQTATGADIHLGKDQLLMANGNSLQYSQLGDGFDYRTILSNLTDGTVTIQFVPAKNTVYTNSIAYTDVTTPDLSNFPATLNSRQDYNIGFTPAPGEKVTMALYGPGADDEVYRPTVLADGSFTAPIFQTSGAYTVQLLVSREKALTQLGTNDAGYIRAVKASEKFIRIQK